MLETDTLHTEPITCAQLKSYSFAEVLKASTKYFKGDQLAAQVWINKYALKDSAGNIYERTPDDMHWRMANELARIEQKYPSSLSRELIYSLLKDFHFIVPQGGPMAGIGNPFQISSLSNCFVIGSQADSYGSIFLSDEEQVQLMKRRGGVGHDLSHIRPKGSQVRNSALSSTGIVPFMERFSNSTKEVAQDGRRGALMLSISIKHPNATDFIDAKLEQGKITSANISIKLDDAFMRAVRDDKPYQQQFPVDAKIPQVSQSISAKKLWDKIVYNAWNSAEPGILFWDTIIRESIPDCYADLGYQTVSTNPCGEIPLCPYDSCRLLAINLLSYVEQPFTEQASFNYDLFGKHVQLAQRIMDDIIDLELEKIDAILAKIDADPEPEEIKATEKRLWTKIRSKCAEGRRMGIGITAEGDMLAALGLRYGTEEATRVAVEVQQHLALQAYWSSVNLARERGAFQLYDSQRESQNPFIRRLRAADPQLYEAMLTYGRRNIALLTIAPTGTTSIMTQTSSGIEPVFMVSYKRRRKVNPNDQGVVVSFKDEEGCCWEEYTVLHPQFLSWLQGRGYSKEQVEKLSDSDLEDLIKASPYYQSTANDIDWVQKVAMQGAIQKWVDHSISVTVNIPNSASVELVGEIYKTAWESGCKGVTVYRDGSRLGVLVSDSEQKSDEEFRVNHSPKRPKKLEAEVVRFQNEQEEWIAVVGLLEEKPYEIFTGKLENTFVLPRDLKKGWVVKVKTASGKNRYDFHFLDKQGALVKFEGLSQSFNQEYWNYAKLISGVLRHGMPLPYAVELVKDLHLDSQQINTWKNGVARALKKFIPDGTRAARQTCTHCGDLEGLIFREGCVICKSCGYTKCE